ncbi:MAG: Peptidoglycan glycosyltransferase [Candidatus Solibacter sp.]|nr:Peptidoglycan glycosyltransferase [Candidatus Solibacter sp.]
MVERRLTCLAVIVLLWGAAIFKNLISLQIIHHREYAGKARAIQEVVVEIPAPRGTIFDRDGQPLAMSLASQSVIINPQKVDVGVASDLLGILLHLDRADLYNKIQQARDTGRGYLIVKRKITPEEYEKLINLRLEWIRVNHESQRHYPKGTLAAHVLGSVDFEEKGNAGVEKGLNDLLRGTPGRTRLLTDVKRRGIESQETTAAKPGSSITLTIDERLQFVAERGIAEAVAAHHANSGSVVVMNPYNGDILAMASYPTFDPNVPVERGQDTKPRMNHAVSVPFEPGSVFKVITLSAALETTSLRPESPINCNGGKIKFGSRTIHDSHGGMGVVPMATVLAKSSNVGAIQVGLRVGQQNMYDYMRRFGFGQKTNVPLPGESPGKVRRLERWGKTSLASVSMGQEVSVTTLQLAQAASVIANGGLLVKPRLVLKKGDQVQPAATPIRVVKAENAITMRQMMEGVVLFGTGTKARLEGYSSGGKTGTAQIYDFEAKHYTHTYNGSYMGFAPLTNPGVVVVVTLNGTRGEGGMGAYVAGPTFKVVASEALRVFDVPKDLPEVPAKGTLVAQNGREDLDDRVVGELGDGPNILEEGDEDAPAPLAMYGPPVAPLPVPAAPPGPKVPNFRGMTMRAVLAEAAAKGLTILPDGSGVARVQSPPPGSPLHQGERIRVQFAR